MCVCVCVCEHEYSGMTQSSLYDVELLYDYLFSEMIYGKRDCF